MFKRFLKILSFKRPEQKRDRAIVACRLEDRVMYSAAPGAEYLLIDAADADLGVGDPTDDSISSLEEFAHAQAQAANGTALQQEDPTELLIQQLMAVADLGTDPATELVIVDTGVEDYEQLVADLIDDSETRYEVIYIDENTDGIDQVSAALSSYSNLSAIHVLSHGSDGAVNLGNAQLNADSLNGYAGQLATWADALNSEGDILFYGCDLAATENGQDLLNALSALCDCDIAASDDLTGHESLGGDWDFEYFVGDVTTEVAFSSQARATWFGTLDIGNGLVLHNTFDTDGSDLSGNANDGELTNGAVIDTTTGTNKIGSGKLSLDGSNDYVDFSDHTNDFQSVTEGTIAVWLYHDVNSRDVIFEMSDSGDENSRIALFRDSDGSFDFYVRNDSTTYLDVQTAASVIPLNTWTHVAVTVDSGGNKLYVNGVQQTVTYTVGSAATNRFFDDVTSLDFGGWGVDKYDDGYTRYFNGFLDDGRVYDRALTSSDITELYNYAAPVTTTLTYQQGVSGYVGTVDTYVHEANPGIDYSSSTEIEVDYQNPGTDNAQGLIRFDDIIGTAGGQIPENVYITSASLTVNVTNPSSTSANITMHEMLESWSDTDTWTSTGGILTNDVEASSTAVSTLGLPTNTGSTTFNGLENSIQAWMDNASNNLGWVIDSSHTDGWDITSSEGTNKPQLSVSYIAAGSQASSVHSLTVDTANDVLDGDASSIDALLANKGADGLISLREAIWATNNTTNIDGSTPDSIYFAIGAGGSTQTIMVNAGGLPTITDALILDASSQGGNQLITLDGTNASGSTGGITLRTNDSTVSGFIVQNFNDEGIEIDGTTGFGNNNIIEDNWVGITAGGAAAGVGDNGILVTAGSNNEIRNNIVSSSGSDGIEVKNYSDNNWIWGNTIGLSDDGSTLSANTGNGVYVYGSSTGNIIGTDGDLTNDANERNIISGNAGAGVHVESDSNTIAGNYIGTDSSGTLDRGNTGVGVYVANAVGTSIQDNVISGNDSYGIHVLGLATTNTAITGNYIGLNAAGTASLLNAEHAIYLSTTGITTIGGVNAGDGNVINAASGKSAINISNTTGATVQGNIIGTNAAGDTRLSAGSFAINVSDATNTQIGGTAAGASNIVAGYSVTGINVGGNSSGTAIQGNYVGTNAAGLLDLTTGFYGVTIQSAATGVLVGGTAATSGNTIAYHSTNGIRLFASAGNSNSFLRNKIYSNGAVGINLLGGVEDANGVTDNDIGDGDSGPNNLQNYPVITSAALDGTDLILSGTLDTDGLSTQYRIEFFGISAGAEDPTNGEAQTYLGTTTVTTNGSGDATFSGVTLSGVTLSKDDFVTATVTLIDDPGQVGISDLLAYGATSEYAANFTVTELNSAPVLDNSKSPTFDAINEDAPAPSGAVGTHVSSLVDFATPSGQVDNVTDSNSSPSLGIAITATDTTNGTFWYSTNNGTNWNALGAVSNASARLLAADANTLIYFQPNANYNGTVSNAITFRAWDQTSGSNGALGDTTTNGGTTAFSTATDTASQTINAVNDAPVLGYAGGGATLPENYGPVLLGPSATVSDIDSANFDGGQLVTTVTVNALPEDRLSVRNEGTGAGQVGVSGLNISYEGTVVGTFNGTTNGGTPLVVTFNSNATAAIVQAVARNVTYENVSDNPSNATRTLEGYLTDGDGGTSGTTSGTIATTPANDSPIAANDTGALIFDGVDDYVEIPDDTVGFSLTMTNTVTMEAWVRPDSGSANSFLMVINKEGEYEVALTPTGEIIWAFDNTDPNWAWHYTGATVTLDEWSHIAVVYDNPTAGATDPATISTYLNGTLVDVYHGEGLIDDAHPTKNTLQIGGRESNPATQYFEGQIADVRIWNTARTAAEVQTNLDAQLVGNEAGLVGYYLFDSGSPSAVVDGSTEGNDGVLGGGVIAQAPTRVQYSTTEDASVSYVIAEGVLNNDTDAEGDSLTVTQLNGVPGAIGSPTALGSGALVTLNADGSFTYNPNSAFDSLAAGQTTTDTFNYTISDGNGGTDTATATVVITGVNDIPTLTSFAAVVDTTNEDTEVEVTLAELKAQGNEADVDGTVDSFIVKSVASGTLKIGTSAGTATAWASGTNDTIDATNHAYWTPVGDANGTLNAFVVVAKDDGGLESSTNVTAQINVVAVNDAPVITSNGGGASASLMINENTTAVTTVASTDIDGGTAQYSISGADAGLFSIGSSSGVLVFTSAPDFEIPGDANGDNIYEVIVQVSDGATGTDTQAISVTVDNVIDTSFDGPSTLIFSQSGGTTPQASDFNGTDFSIATGTSNIDGPWRVLAGSESPDRDEKIVVGVDAAGNLSGQMWDGSAWTAFTFNDFSTVSDSSRQGFAVEYESVSGNAILVWNNGTTGTSGLSYKVWDGATWSATNTITTPVTGEPSELQLATAPGSDEMVLVGSNASNQDFAIVWDGDNWGDAQTLSTIAGSSNTEIAVVYEQQSGDAMVVYGDNTSSAHYRIWNGTTWSSEQDLTPPAGVTGQVTWTSVASDLNSDRIAFSAHTDNDETWLAVWNGSSWSDKLLASTDETNNTFRSVAVAFESLSGDLLAVYSEDHNRIRYRTWDTGSGWSAETVGVDLGDRVRTITLTSRLETDQIMLTALDDGGDINSPLWDGRSWSERNEIENNSGETTTQPFLFLWDENPAYLTAANDDTAFWFSTSGDVNSKGGAGLNAWTSGEVLALGDPDLQLEPVDGTTTATATSVFNLDDFGGDTKIDAIHYVGADIQVGSSNYNLLAGDILFSTQDAETLVSTNTLTVANSDIIVFRADSVGDYSSGSFYVLLENPTGLNLQSISLVEQNTIVGDTTLQAGDFLMSTGTSVLLYETTDVGVGTTSGTVQTLLDGLDTNVSISEDISGIELYESDTVIGGHTILAGTVVVSIEKDITIGSNSLSVKKHDLVALSVAQTTLVAGSGNGSATAQLIMDGSDIGLTSGSETISGFTAIANNQAPTDISPNSLSVDENIDTSSGYSVGTLTATDVDAGETFTYEIVGGADAAKFSIGGGSNDELILTDGTLDFESKSSYSVTVRVTDSTSNVYEETLTVSVNDVNEAPVITGGPDSSGLTETDSGLTSTGTFTVTDQDTTDLVTAAVDSVGVGGTGSGSVPGSLTNTILKGFLSVSPTAILNGSETTNTLTWNFNSGSEAFDFLAAGETLVLTYTVSATDDDGTPLSDTETVTITITGTNDASVVASTEGTPLSYTENDGAVAITSTLAITDVDDTNIESAVVQITGGYNASEDVLSFSDQNGITGSYNALTGTWTLTGTATIAQYETAIRSITYTNTSENPDTTTRTVSFTVNDGNVDSNTQTRDIDITALNDDPTNSGSLPGDIGVTEDVSSNVDFSLLNLSDVDHGGGNLMVTLTTSTGGNLSATTGGGVTVGGSGSGTLTLTGTVTDLNTFFDTVSNISYLHGTPGMTGDNADTITVVVNDNGNTGSGGGTDQNLGTVNVDIGGVNDAPVNTVPGTQSVAEETATAISGISIADSDAGGSNVTTQLQVSAGVLNVTLSGGASISAGTNGSGDLTIQGTVADINATLASLTYTGNTDVTGVNADTLTVTTNDLGNTGSGGALQDVDTVQIDITAVNDTPVVSGPGSSYTVNEQTNLSIEGTGFSVADVDAASGTMTATLTVGEGSLTVAEGDSGVTISVGNGTGTVTLTGTLTEIDNLLTGSGTGTITYNNGSDTPSATTTITVTVNDGGNTGADPGLTGNGTSEEDFASQTINITAMNDTPVVSGPGSSYTVNEQTNLSIEGTGFSVADVDAASGTMTATLTVGEGSLTVAEGDSGVTISVGNGTGTVTLTGTLTEIDNLLTGSGTGTITYNNGSDTPSATTTITVTVNDGGNTGADPGLTGNGTSEEDFASQTINNTALNDDPTNSGSLPGDIGVTEDVSSNVDFSLLNLSDVDHGGGNLMVTLTTSTGGNLSATTGGGVTVGGSGSGTLTLTGTVTDLNTFFDTVSNISYLHGTPGMTGDNADTITVVVNDNGNTGSGGGTDQNLGTVNVDIGGVNDAPVNTVPGTQSVAEESATAISGISIADSDAGGSNVTTQLQVSAGVLNVTLSGGASISAGTNGSGDLTIQGTVADINATLASLTYTGNTDVTGTNADTLTVTTNDLGNTGSGGALQDVDTVQIDITAVNDTPVVSGPGSSYTVNEQTNLSIEGTGFSVSDVDAASGTMTATLTVGEGALTVAAGDSGVTISGGNGTGTVTLTGTLTEIDSLLTGSGTGTITYNNGSDTPSAITTITVTVNDGGNTGADPGLTGNGTSEEDFASQTIYITALNDDPTNGGSLPTDVTILEDVTTDIDLSSVDILDVDASSGSMTVTLSVGSGVLDAAAGTGITIAGSGSNSVTLDGTLGDLNNYLNTTTNIQYTGALNLNGDDADILTFIVNDNGNTGSGGGTPINFGSMNIDLTAVNDDPVNIGGLLPSTVTLTEDVAADLDLSAMVIDDVDVLAGNLTITMTTTSGATLSTSGGTGITVGGSGTTSMTVSGTIADVNAFIADSTSVQLQGAADAYGVNADQVTVTLSDNGNTGLGGGGPIAMGVINVDINPVNDAAVVSNLEPAPLYYTENDGAVSLTSLLSLSDVDDTHLESATVQITGNYINGEDLLAFVDTVNISGSFDALSGMLTLTGTDTISNYEAALRSITYENISDDPSGLTRTVSFTVNDGDVDSNIATRNISVTPVNDAPIAYADGPIIGNEASSFTLTPTSNDIDFENDTLTITAINGSPIVAGGASIAVTGGTMNLAADGITLTFTPTTNFDGDADFTYTITDGNGLYDTATVDLDIVDTRAPDMPLVTILEDANNDGFINIAEQIGDLDLLITLPVSALEGESLSINGVNQVLNATDISNGYVIATLPAPAHNDTVTVSVYLFDPAGNTSSTHMDIAYVDLVGPTTSGALDLIAGSDNGLSNSDDYTGDLSPIFRLPAGTGDPGDLVRVFADGVEVGTDYVNADGSADITATISSFQVFKLTYTFTDVAGNESPPSIGLFVEFFDATLPYSPPTDPDVLGVEGASSDPLAVLPGPTLNIANDEDEDEENIPFLPSTFQTALFEFEESQNARNGSFVNRSTDLNLRTLLRTKQELEDLKISSYVGDLNFRVAETKLTDDQSYAYQLDAMVKRMGLLGDELREELSDIGLLAGTATVGASVAIAGYAFWATRAAWIAGWVATSIPTFTRFDPLVLLDSDPNAGESLAQIAKGKKSST